MQSKNAKRRNIVIRIIKIDEFLRFFNMVKEFSVNKFKKLYQKGKELVKFFSDTKKILILSRFTLVDTLSFSEIQRELDVSSSQLSYDLKKMTDLGFLEKIHREERENKRFSFYKITLLGRKVIEQIFFFPKG
ncbi:MAG: helix-turn-helix transcriptional regulator [Candidatus Helarchaeota archaeon]|nr:helix-turn-helix transcriptional regulator [Candidatus Helarchaeota archaeon]